MGACIATVISEIVVTVIHVHSVRDALDIKKYIFSTVLFLLTGLMMFGVVYTMRNLQTNGIVKLLIQIFTGVVIYLMLNSRYIKQNVDFSSLFSKFKR